VKGVSIDTGEGCVNRHMWRIPHIPRRQTCDRRDREVTDVIMRRQTCDRRDDFESKQVNCDVDGMHFGDYRQDFAGGVREPVLVASPLFVSAFSGRDHTRSPAA